MIMRLAMTRSGCAWRGRARPRANDGGCGTPSGCARSLLGLLALPEADRPWVFMVMALLEMAVPLYAERAHPTPWHPHHIAERYGLLTLIVLGETIAAATVAVKSGIDEHEPWVSWCPSPRRTADHLRRLVGVLAVPIHGHLRSNRQSFLWGYGHYLIFVSGAAIGAGLEVAVEQAVGHGAPFGAVGVGGGDTADSAIPAHGVGAALALLQGVDRAAVGAADHGSAGGRLYVPGNWAVLAAGLVAALAVAAGVTLTALGASPERGKGGESAAVPVL
ncbi:hypothetical protein GS580_27605 [Rhodococcus hoagii]|nr:hypothetical protein [Prescottella equi]